MKKLIVLLMAITLLTACPSPNVPTPPDDGVTTTVEGQSVILSTAINTGCTLSNTYVQINSYYPFIKPFIPANISGTITPILNAFHSALNLYNSSVLAWVETKNEPANFVQLQENLVALNNQLVPLIQQIIDIAKKSKDTTAIQSAENLDTKMKGVFSCTIEDLKSLANRVKELPVLS